MTFPLLRVGTSRLVWHWVRLKINCAAQLSTIKCLIVVVRQTVQMRPVLLPLFRLPLPPLFPLLQTPLLRVCSTQVVWHWVRLKVNCAAHLPALIKTWRAVPPLLQMTIVGMSFPLLRVGTSRLVWIWVQLKMHCAAQLSTANTLSVAMGRVTKSWSSRQ
jgi:hypothetical protein